MSYNQALYNLYEPRLGNLFDKLKNLEQNQDLKSISSPLLLSVKDEQDHKDADVRIMIFGQETSSWFRCLEETIVEHNLNTLLKIYCDFYYWHERGYKDVSQSPFHNFRDQLKNQLNDELAKNFPNKKVSYIVNNLYKFGKSGGPGRAPEWFLELEREHFNVIQEEIRILDIDLCIFLTGPNYDNRIREIFGIEGDILSKFEEGSSKRSIARVEAGKLTGIRIYHPAFLRRKSLETENRERVVHFITAVPFQKRLTEWQLTR